MTDTPFGPTGRVEKAIIYRNRRQPYPPPNPGDISDWSYLTTHQPPEYYQDAYYQAALARIYGDPALQLLIGKCVVPENQLSPVWVGGTFWQDPARRVQEVFWGDPVVSPESVVQSNDEVKKMLQEILDLLRAKK